ncbi:branched-chain amino acid ABC transporter permease, partial [uncultured Clostridium sp.]|uniref:branched-chain amino acid ABC transporter permease n=1 Tax=uncultured Clostridium sp. TaxID=59620 RepID=UPI0025DB5972
LIAVIISGLFAALLASFIFYGKINNIFTGIITMCVATVLETFMTQTSDGKWKVLGVPLGGFNGLNNIPSLAIGNFDFIGPSFYILVIVFLLIIYLLMRKVQVSRSGYALFGIRENQIRSELFGYNTAKIQTIAFSVSGALAGLAGVLFASWSGYVVPTNFSVSASTIAVVMVAVAGRKNVTGAMIMTLIYSWFTQFLATTGSEYSQLILGVLLILVVLFIPDGILVALFKKSDEFFYKMFNKNKEKSLEN